MPNKSPNPKKSGHIRVFISHSSKDKKLVDSFSKNILLLGIGFEANEIRNISSEGSKIPHGANWRNTLKQSLQEADIVFQIISPNYQDCEMCLLEMGASWITNALVIPLIIPPVTFENAGILKEVEQMEKLIDSQGLDRIRDSVSKRLPELIEKSTIAEWNSHKTNFLEEANKFLAEYNFTVNENNKIEATGFRKASINEIMKRTEDTLPKVNFAKIVGFGRQYMLEYSKDEIIESYLTALENRLLDSKSAFECQRLTIMDLNSVFVEHLKRCFINAEKSNSVSHFQVSIIDDLEMKFTYYILGEKLAVINIYYRLPTNQIVDCPDGLITSNVEIIKMFIEHFNRVWKREKDRGSIIGSLFDFEKRIPYKPEIIEAQKNINAIIKTLPHASARASWAVSEIKQLEYRLKGLFEYSLNIKNKIDNGKLLNIIAHFVKLLHADDSYSTISFYEFWQFILSESLREFIDANRTALENGARIFRIYLIDNSRLHDDKYIAESANIFQKHLELVRKFRTSENYKFKLVFIEKEQYDEYKNEYKNFAIWESKLEKIYFNPKYDQTNEIYPAPFETQLFFVDKTQGHKNYVENQEMFVKATSVFMDIKSRVPSLTNLSKEQKEFLIKCSVDDSEQAYFFL